MNRKINNYINQIEKQPFKWGENDCYTFLFDILHILYPHHTLPNLKNKYHSELSAIKLLKEYSWYTELPKAFIIEIHQSYNARDGDIVLFKNQNMECAHYVWGDQVYSLDIKQGLLNWNIGLLDHHYQIYRILCQQPSLS